MADGGSGSDFGYRMSDGCHRLSSLPPQNPLHRLTRHKCRSVLHPDTQQAVECVYGIYPAHQLIEGSVVSDASSLPPTTNATKDIIRQGINHSILLS
jgi:hypothetical protein